ncbi:MAG: sulfatase-like hydrolase/transferase [Chitinivibrionales bacterium]|nr:sulfatase-like hydrolase/transferase [Chitinivibrionales bacterium]
MSERLNIVHFICHDLGQELGCYGKPIASPNLDRFAAEGVQFTNAFCNSPACSPARGCLMTGQYAHTSGGIGLAHMGWPLPQDAKTIVDYLNDAGYETAHVGLNHERHAGTNHYQIDEEKTWDDWQADNAVDGAIGYLRSRADTDKPFYLNIGTHEVHASAYRHKADTVYGGPVPDEDVFVPLYSPELPGMRKEMGRFQAAIRFLDTQFGRLMAAIDDLNLDRNTIVLFTTDHGISNNRAKGTLYDRGVEVALMMRLPKGMRGGYRVDHLVQHIDVTPTLLEALGIPRPAELQGTSLWPLLAGGEYTPHEHIFIERNFHGQKPPGQDSFADVYDPVRSIRTPEYHYIRWMKPGAWHRPYLPWEAEQAANADTLDGDERYRPNHRPRAPEELYHVAHDTLEFINVADRPEYRHIKADLAAKLKQWMEQTGDFAMTDSPPEHYEERGWGENWPRE